MQKENEENMHFFFLMSNSSGCQNVIQNKTFCEQTYYIFISYQHINIGDTQYMQTIWCDQME